jgi:hypothetical protein
MPGIITPSFPFAGWMVPLSLELPGLLPLFLSVFTSTSTRGISNRGPLTRSPFAAVFADLFRVAILAASSVRIFRDVQTLYVLVLGGTFANDSGQTRRKSLQWRRRNIERKAMSEDNHPSICRKSLPSDSFQAVVRLSIQGRAERPEALSLVSADASNEIFALDTGADFLHSEITSQPAQRPVPRSRSLHASLDAALQFS